MGEQVTVTPEGQVERRRILDPNPELIVERVEEAWETPSETFEVELPEDELNQFLASVDDRTELPVEDLQVWLTDGEARFCTVLTEPTEINLGATFDIQVVDGRLVPQIEVETGGLPVPIPGPLMDFALQTALGQLQVSSGMPSSARRFIDFPSAIRPSSTPGTFSAPLLGPGTQCGVLPPGDGE